MTDIQSTLNVLTLNCWGLKFVAKERESRLAAIGQYIADPAKGYDIVGLQECWVYTDYLKIKETVRQVLPYTRYWPSGVLGSGLVILSKFPIVQTQIKRFSLGGDPMAVFHGDWYVGKCCVSAILQHPTCGEIEVFNTHMHAGYDPVGTVDRYLGCRTAEAWEMATLIKASTTQGRHVISLGDYNSDPDSLVVNILTKQAGLNDSWDEIHPAPTNPIPRGMSPEEAVELLGVTCDTPLNTWSGHVGANYLTQDMVGERLDYIFYRNTPEFQCTQVKVAVREQIRGIGSDNSGIKNYSDHYGVNALFNIKPAQFHHGSTAAQQLLANSTSNVTITAGSAISELSLDKLEQIVQLLKLSQDLTAARCKKELIFSGVAAVTSIALSVGFFWIRPRWVAGILSFVLMALSAGWIVHFLYGFIYGGEQASTFTNAIDDVQVVLDQKLRESGGHGNGSQGSAHGGTSSNKSRSSLLK